MLRTIIYFHVYIILDFPITYRNASVLCQSECACLHKTVNIVVFFAKRSTQKGEQSHANVQSCPYNEKREFKTDLLLGPLLSVLRYKCFTRRSLQF